MLRILFFVPKSASKYSEEVSTFTTRSLLEKKNNLENFLSSFIILVFFHYRNSKCAILFNCQKLQSSPLIFHLCMHRLRSSANPLPPTGHQRSCAQSSTLFHSPHPSNQQGTMWLIMGEGICSVQIPPSYTSSFEVAIMPHAIGPLAQISAIILSRPLTLPARQYERDS